MVLHLCVCVRTRNYSRICVFTCLLQGSYAVVYKFER